MLCAEFDFGISKSLDLYGVIWYMSMQYQNHCAYEFL